MLELYQPGAKMFSGDEDNGEMGAWFVLSALGLYSLAPSSPNWILGSPLFARTVMALESGEELVVVAHNNSKQTPASLLNSLSPQPLYSNDARYSNARYIIFFPRSKEP